MNYKKIIEGKEYDFLREDPSLGDNIQMLVVGGSRSYGTNNEQSDIDIRGFFLEDKRAILGLSNVEQVIDNTTDTTIYSMTKLINLLANCNPNVIELLGTREEEIIYMSPLAQELREKQDMFLSKRAIGSFGGYANQQLSRLRNALDKEYPIEEQQRNTLEAKMYSFNRAYTDFEEGSLKAKTKDGKVLVDINLKDYPLSEFSGMIREIKEVEKMVALNQRNKKRSVEALDKHAMHLVRLYLMAIDILLKEQIITYRENDLDLLMDIRNGKYRVGDSYEYKQSFWDLVSNLTTQFEEAKIKTKLPRHPNMKSIEDFIIKAKYDSLIV